MKQEDEEREAEQFEKSPVLSLSEETADETASEAKPIDSVLQSKDPFPIPNNHGPLPTFGEVLRDLVIPIAQVKRDPYGTRSMTSMRFEIVQKFVRHYRWTVGDNMYPVARLLLPERDNRLYHVKESKLGDLFIDIFKIPKNSNDYGRIKNWKRSAENSFGRGDNGFADICCEALKFRGALNVEGNVVTVDEMNTFLNKFGAHQEQVWESEDKESNDLKNKKNFQRRLLEPLVKKMNLEEIKYLIKIMLKLKILKGMEKTFLATWHPEAPRLLDLINDLQRIFYQLYNPQVKLESSHISIKVMHPYKPQLASKSDRSYEELAAKFNHNFYIEEKLDGERMQLHMDEYGKRFMYYSRKAVNYTMLYGQNYDSGSLTKYIKGCFNSSVRNVIIDGEMVVFDHTRQAFLPFGSLKGSALSTLEKGLNEEQRPMFIAYDLVYLNDKSLENATLEKRREAMKKVLNPIRNVIDLVNNYKVTSANEIEMAIRKAIEVSSEGILLKNPNSKYLVAERSNDWIKVKPEYLDEFGEDADLLIIGKTAMHKTSYMCGLRDPKNEEKLLSFCNIANGISLDTYKSIEKKLGPHWRKITKKQYTNVLEFGSKLPEEWIHPKDSLVIQVKARSVDLGLGGASYKVGTTLYNAFFKQIRDDKDWQTCMTVEEYGDLKSSHTSKRKLEESEMTNTRAKKKRKFARLTTKQKMAKELARDDKVSLGVSNVFHDGGLNFLILSDAVDGMSNRVSKQDLETIVKQNGGEVISDISASQNKVSEWWQGGKAQDVIIISSKRFATSEILFNEGYDIFKPCWIFDCLKTGKMVNFEPRHCLHASEEMKLYCEQNVDRFGDSYVVPFSSSLLDISNSIIMKHQNKTGVEGQAEAQEELRAENELFYLFESFKFNIVHSPRLDEDHCLKIKSIIRLYHGQLTKDRKEATHFVIIEDKHITDESDHTKSWRSVEERKLKKLISEEAAAGGSNGRLARIPRVVDGKWVEDYIDKFK